MKLHPSHRFRSSARIAWAVSGMFAGLPMHPAAAGAEETAETLACTTTVDVASLARALDSRKPAGATTWEIGVRGSDCMLTITDGSGTWMSGIRADREPMLVAAEASWAWLHRERAMVEATYAGQSAATGITARVGLAAEMASPPSMARVADRPAEVAPPQQGRVGLGATALNGRTVSTLSAGYAVPLSSRWSAGADGWCALSPVGSQFVYVDRAEATSARPDIQVASMGGFIAATTRWSGMDLGVRSGLALLWAHARLASELADVSETAWLPEASVSGRLGVRIGAAEPAIEFGYRAVVGDEKVVGPSSWAFAGPTASLSLGWRVE